MRRVQIKIFRQVPGLPEGGKGVFWILLLTLAMHLSAIYFLPSREDIIDIDKLSKGIKVKINQQNPEKLYFSKQQETAPPEVANHYGQENHKAAMEQKTSSLKKANSKEITNSSLKAQEMPEKTVINREKKSPSVLEKNQNKPARDELYKKFLPSKEQLAAQISSGYEEYLDEAMVLGDNNDVNTKEHPLMGFFAQIRRSVELAFYDPDEIEVARFQNQRGLDGLKGSTVALIDIDRSGRIIDLKVLKTSGHEIMDEHWMKILRASGPFQPIPKVWPKEHLRFSYTLNYRYSAM